MILIGQLLRHATFLEANIVELGIFEALNEAVAEGNVIVNENGVKEDNKPVKRKAAAALGELLFYVATQPNTGGSDGIGYN